MKKKAKKTKGEHMMPDKKMMKDSEMPMMKKTENNPFLKMLAARKNKLKK